MIDYLYDGTFEGILTCIYHHYYTEKADGIYPKEQYQANMLKGYREIETDEEKATTVYEAIERKISTYDLRCMYRAYLSNAPGKETAILKYAILGFQLGGKISSLRNREEVYRLQNIVHRVGVEQERMLQFVRFSVMSNGVMYSEIEPDNDVLELIAYHFTDRFQSEPFIIRDKGRNKALVAYHKQWYITVFNDVDVPSLSQEEKLYRRLWKNYFDNIAIKERTNKRCQRNFMPERYWKNLTEMTERNIIDS